MKRLLFLFLALFFAIFLGKAQDTEFWFGAPDDSNIHGGCDRPTFLLISTTDQPATVQVFLGNMTTPRRTVNIAANSFHKEDFTATEINNGLVENSTANDVAGTVQNKAIFIKSTVPVSAYYQVDGECSKDVFTLKGKRALGTHFFTPFQTRYGVRNTYTDAFNHFVIVATENDTHVDIVTQDTPNPDYSSARGASIYRPLSEGGNIDRATSFSILLQKGQTYTVREATSRSTTANTGGTGMWSGRGLPTLAGTEVKSNKPIAITVAEPGITARTSQTSYPATDLLGDQIVPVRELGTHHAVVHGFRNSNGEEWVYLTATENGTVVYANNGNTITNSVSLNKGQHWAYQITTDNGIFFNSNHPVYCYQQSAAASEVGASLIPSLFSISAKINSFYRLGKNNADYAYIFLMFRTGAHGSFRLNGSPLTVTATAIPGASDWSFARVSINPTNNNGLLCRITNPDSPFSVGFFSYLTTTTTSFGYLSKFGAFSFESDTIYKCKDSAIPLDAGYNMGQNWILPDGSTDAGPIIYAADTGLYRLTVDHDYMTVRDSILVLNRFNTIGLLVGPSNIAIGSPQKYYVDLGGEYNKNLTYQWTVSGYSNLTTDTVSYAWTDNATKTITVKVSDTELGCDTTLTISVSAELYSVSGKVSGLSNNNGITVNYKIDNGTLKSVTTTTTDGEFIIPNVPYYSKLEIIPTYQTSYTTPENLTLTNVITDHTGLKIIYNLAVYRWWYISTPFSNSNSNSFDIPTGTVGTATGSMLGYYDEQLKQYTNPLGSDRTLVPLLGIVASLDTNIAVFNPPTIETFKLGGSYGTVANTGRLTTTVYNTDNVPAQRLRNGKNLLGNPYLYPIDFDLFYVLEDVGINNSERIEPTYWVRGWNGLTMIYDSYNALSQLGTKNINFYAPLTNVIPTVQGFWIQAKSTGIIGFNNDIRITGGGGAPAYRSPSVNVGRAARLAVKGEITSDETIIVFHPGASNDYDLYDSEKMSNDNDKIPELYTKIESRELVINGMQPVIGEAVIPLGFRTGQAGSFNISGDFENWDNTKMFLRDNNSGTEVELTAGKNHSFTSGIYNNTSRFSIIIKGTPAGVNTVEHNTSVFINEKNRIEVHTDIPNVECVVYNTLGQQIASEIITTIPQTLNYTPETGVYIVKIGSKTDKVIVK